MQPQFRVDGWSRGGEIATNNIAEEIPRGWDARGSRAWAQACEIESEYWRAYDNPRGRLALNVSRAIRTGHDRIWEARNA